MVAWIERMLDPKREGDFESLKSLEPTLRPIFEREVGPRFLAWDAANSKAWAAGAEKTELTMEGRQYYQKTFKYPAHTLSVLRQKFEAARHDSSLISFLDATGCLSYLESEQSAQRNEVDPGR